MTLDQLYEVANSKGIEIDDVPMRALRAVALPEGWIAMDSRKFKDETEYKCVLAHEIGHCLTRTFYNIYTQVSVKELNERQANRFAAELLVPFCELRKAWERGISFNRTLARIFDVTVDFINMVLELFEKELCTVMRNHLFRQSHTNSIPSKLISFVHTNTIVRCFDVTATKTNYKEGFT